MNILYHHRTQGRGVERVHILGVVDAWRRQGHCVDIISPPGVEIGVTPSQVVDQTALNPLAYLAHRAPPFCFEAMELAYNLRALAACHRRLRSRRYGFFYERYAYLGLAGLLSARRWRIPFVLEVNFTADTEIVRRRSTLIRGLDRRVERRVLTRADLVVVVSSRLKELVVASGADADKVLVLPNGADPAVFSAEVDDSPLRRAFHLEGRPVVGFVGHFYPWHGVDLLLDTFESVRRQCPNVAYVLVGDGPTQAETAKVVAHRRWGDDVLLTGRVSHDDVARYCAVFDVAVMPHSNDYGSPMKIAEYMAMGKAVVAPRLGPIVDMLEDGKSGLLFRPGDTEDLARQLAAVLRDGSRRLSLGKAARHVVETRLNWDEVGARVLAFVSEKSISSR